MSRHTWNDQTRRNAPRDRRARMRGQEPYVACILRRVEAVGGGVTRACRVLDELRGKYRFVKRRGEWVPGRWHRGEVLRYARLKGIDLGQDHRNVPGQGEFPAICPRCFGNLSSSPWCDCLPKPAGAGAFAWFQEDCREDRLN